MDLVKDGLKNSVAVEMEISLSVLCILWSLSDWSFTGKWLVVVLVGRSFCRRRRGFVVKWGPGRTQTQPELQIQIQFQIQRSPRLSVLYV